MDQLAADLVAHDGAPVTVSGFLLITDEVARLCSASLESYPPQCGRPSIAVLGVPPGFVASLDSTNQPDLAQASWGWVEISGVVDVAGSDGEPAIAVSSITLGGE